ncbi:MAG: LysR family transcriptional regulator [Caulobacteraceae bacterium]|nr:LysR family transcriptional regulator [Caulobacteraceae bacterium]
MDRLAELRIFIEVIERGNYSSAARSLDLTPSAVSKSISRLEQRLGARLLERSSRSMRPTSDGETFYSAAKRAIEAVNEAEDAVSGSLRSPEGDLRILVPPSFAIYQLARVVPAFRERYPKIRLEFILRNEPLDMAEHWIDLAIRVGRPPDSDMLIRKISSSGWVICAAPSYLRRRGAPATLQDLREHECLGYALETRRHGGAHAEGPALMDEDLEASSLASNNGSMLQALARVGAGIVRLAEYHVGADLAAGRLVRLFPDLPAHKEDVFAIYPRKLRGSARLRAFLDFLQERFAAPDWSAAAGEPAEGAPAPVLADHPRQPSQPPSPSRRTQRASPRPTARATS